MESYQVTFQFSDSSSCAAFHKALIAQESSQEGFEISVPEKGFNYDNQYLTLLITFMANGGLDAIGPLVSLIKFLLEKMTETGDDKPPVPQNVTIIIGDNNQVNISTDMSKTEIENKFKDVFR